jgi:hypothetical protein
MGFMTSKFPFLLIFLATYSSTTGQIKGKVNFINPTGSYRLDNKTEIKHGEKYGYFGGLKVKLLNNSKIAICFFICKGAPSYNSGSFSDTLKYQKNQAIYRIPEDDSTCRITLIFKSRGVMIEQTQKDLNNGCGFGQGVFANGFYKKKSNKVPAICDIEDEYYGTNGILKKN